MLRSRLCFAKAKEKDESRKTIGDQVLTLSSRLGQISESQTVALTSLLNKMKREGKDVLSLGAGEPDFPTPPHVQSAAIRAIEEGHTKYTTVSGVFELKQAIAEWIKNEHAAVYSPDDIVITCGAKHAIYQSILAICNPDDEIIVPTPYWVSYPEQIKLAGGIAKTMIPEGPDLKITAGQLEKSISPKTKAIILNSPSNPSGAVYTKSELTSIVRVLKNSGIYVISDEIYDKILFDNLKYTSMTVFDEIRDQLVYINGVSKSYAMTGWRIGFLAAHQSIVSAVVTYQGHSITHPSTISQKAALEAYRSEHSFINEMVRAYQHRRDYVMQRLAAIKNVICIRPQGAFYAFPDLSWYYTKDMGVTNSLELCYYLLEHFGVATVPGAAFGMDQHVRLSYATSLDILEKALDRIQSGLESLAR